MKIYHRPIFVRVFRGQSGIEALAFSSERNSCVGLEYLGRMEDGCSERVHRRARGRIRMVVPALVVVPLVSHA